MSTRTQVAGVALALAVSCTALYLVGTGGHAIHNGDEAMYAEAAREMVETGDYADLRWQGDIQLVRPPLAVWVLVLGRVFLDGEHAVRWPLAAMAGLEVGLVFVLGFLWLERRWLGGLCAAGVLATADLFVGYARYVESEPVLCVCILAALIGWELGRRRRGWVILWGVGLGAALMTKQLVGAIPLLCPLAELLAGDAKSLWRKTGVGLVAALLVWAPWHLRQTLHHGARFWSAYLGQNVVERSQTALLHVTRPTYYLREAWRSEGVFAVAFAVALAACAYLAVRRRRRQELSIALWALGPLLVFTVAQSRYDHYVLVIYPALALAVAALIVALPVRPILRALVAAVWIGGAFVTHVWRDLSSFDGEDEVRALMRVVDAPVYVYNTHAYAAKYYLDHAPISTLLESRTDFDIAMRLHAAGMPAPVILATDLAATVGTLPRPHFILLPRARAALLPDAKPTAETRHYLLLHNP